MSNIGGDNATQVEVPANGVIDASDSSTNFTLQASTSDVASYARQGDDLVLTMRNGEAVRIHGFFAHGVDFNHLILVNGDQAQEVDLAAVLTAPADGVDAAPAAEEAGARYASLLSILGGLAVGVAGIHSLVGGGNVAPATPNANLDDADANGRINASGTAEPGAKISVIWPDNTSDTVTAGQDGKWSIESSKVQTSGNVTVTATNAAGHQSPPSVVAYHDTTAPQAPSVTVADSTGSDKINATGTAEPGAKISVIWPDNTSSTVTAGQDGQWSVASPTAQTSGAVTVTATDTAGNVSKTASASYTDITKPPQVVTVTMLVNDGTDHAGPVIGVTPNDGSAGSTIADTSPRVVGTLSAPLNAGEQLQVLRDGVVVGNATVSGTDWSYDDTDLKEGSSYVYTAQIKDAANNLGAVSGGFTVQAVAASTAAVALSGVAGTEAADTLTDAVATGTTHTSPFSIDGGPGDDTINLTPGGGHTRLVYLGTTSSSNDPTGNGYDTVNGFHVGAVGTDADADIIALSSALLPADAANNLGKYVQVTTSGSDTIVAVDTAFAAVNTTGSDQFTPLLKLVGVQTTLAQLMANQQIVVGATPTVTATIDSVLDDTSPVQGLVQNGGTTNDPTPTLMGQLSAPLTDDQMLEVLRDGVVVGTSNNNFSGTWVLLLNSPLVVETNGTHWSFADSLAPLQVTTADGSSSQNSSPTANDGPHSYTVRVVNADGEAGTQSDPFNLTYESGAPAAMATATIAGFADDVGTVGFTVLSGSVTDDMAPQLNGTLSGTLGADQVVAIYRNGTLVGDATVSGSNWTYQDSGLTDGHSYSYVAQVVDATGNQSAASSPFVINADATPLAHTAQITGSIDDVSVPGVLIPVENEFPSEQGGYTNDGTPLLSGTVSAALGDGEYVAIYRDNEMVGSATVTGTTWTFSDSAQALSPETTYTYTARVEDAAGDRSETSAAYTLNVVTPPITTGSSSGDTFNTSTIEADGVHGSVISLLSSPGNDTYTLNPGDGHIKLVFDNLDSLTNATGGNGGNGGNGNDTATGFHIGNIATDSDADLIALSQLLPSTVTIDTSNIASYVSATASGSDTVIAVNRTGSSTAQFTPLLTLTGVSTTVDELMNNHQIVV
jgi:hypothetical protein